MDLNGLPYALEPMQRRDIPTVSRIEQEVFSLPWSTSAFRYELEHNEASYYVVLRYLPWMTPEGDASLLGSMRRALRRSTHDPSLVGYGGCWIMVDEAHISTLAVRAIWRGRGLGELLMVALIEEAYRRDATEVTLEVRVSNTIAQSLYEKYGFQRLGTRRGYYSDNREDAYIMTTASISSPAYRREFDALCAALRQRLLSERQAPPPEKPLEQTP
jgi:[ribosomal protein S18]-alanine N-acetyltransferase